MFSLLQSLSYTKKNNCHHINNLLNLWCPNCSELFFIEPGIENNCIKIGIKKLPNLLASKITNNDENLILSNCPHCHQNLSFNIIIRKNASICIETNIYIPNKKNNIANIIIDRKDKIQESRKVVPEKIYTNELSITRRIISENDI